MNREIYLKRIEKLIGGLEEMGLRGIVVTGSSNLLYFTGTDAASLALIWDGGGPLLITSRLEYVRALEEARIGEVVAYCEVEAATAPYEKVVKGDLYSVLRREVERVGLEPSKLGVTLSSLSYESYSRLTKALGISPKDATQLVKDLRAVKCREEVSLIEKAARIAEEALRKALNYLEKGVRECDVAALLASEIRRRGALPAFEPIVAFGEHSAHPHAKVGSRKLREGELVKIDVGARVEGYCSDITRVTVVGRASKEQRRMLEAVLRAQEVAVAVIEDGAKACQVDEKAREILRGEGFLEYFTHSLGHGLGLDVHEAPILSPTSKDVLRRGMVVTVEPGVYVRGLGGVRVEDDVLVCEEGARIITKFERELL